MASTKAKIGFIKGSPIIDVAELPNPVTNSAISPTGTYDKIYFNTELSVDEVNALIDSVITDSEGRYDPFSIANFVHNGTNYNATILSIQKSLLANLGFEDDGSAYMIMYSNPINESDIVLYCNVHNELLEQYYGITKIGWQDFNNPIVLPTTYNGSVQENTIEQNELLKDLIYVEEIDESKINTKALYRLPDGTLWHYNGQWNAVGSGSSNGIIEVDTLPTENINTKAIYKTPEKFIDSYIHDINTSGLLSDAYNVGGAEVVETKPTSDIVESTMSALHLYYVTSENDIFLYMNIGAGATWYSASQILSANGLTGLTFKGGLLEGETPNENGYYAYYSPKKLYKYNNNKFNEIDGVNATINNLFNGGRITEKLEINYPNELRDGDFDYINVDYLKLILSNTIISTDNEKYINVHTNFFTAKFKTLYLTHTNRDVYLNFFSTASFGFCNHLKSLVLDFGVFKPTSGSIFSNSTIAEGTGFVYVPDDKVNEVKALSGWSNYASQIKPLSEYKED